MSSAPPGEGGPVDIGVSGFENAVEVGRGGFAVVYRAWQPGFDRHVAIKVVSSKLDAKAMSRFERECVAIGALSEHPNIVTVHELGWTSDGRPFIVMEFLTSGSLGARLDRQGPLDWRQATEVTIKVAGALESAHLAGVLHRDVKPENVLVSRYGDVKLGDFGIARIHGYSETTSGVTASWSHAPPEVVNGTRPSVSSDIYSLGSTLYTLLVGQPPFHRSDDEGLLTMLARISTDPVPDLRPAGVPDAICRVIEQAMAKEPAERPASAATMGRRLQDAQAEAGVPVTALPLEVVEGAGRIRAELPEVDWSDSDSVAVAADADGSTRESVSTFAVGAPPVPVAGEPTRAPVEPPPAAARVATPPAAPVAVPATGPPSTRWPLVAVAVVLVVGALAALLVARGGDEPPPPPVAQPTLEPAPSSTAAPTTTAPVTTPPTTAPVVRYSVSDQLQPTDASEDVELIVDGGQPVRFPGSPPGIVRPIPLTVATPGRHSYRLVVNTTSNAGATTRLTGSGNFDVQEGRHFEVAFVSATTVCLALEGVCQE